MEDVEVPASSAFPGACSLTSGPPDSVAAVLYPSCAVALFYSVPKKCFVDPRPLELLLETGSKTKQNKLSPHVLRWGCGSVGRELAWHAQGPGFNPQFCVSQAHRHIPVISASGEIG